MRSAGSLLAKAQKFTDCYSLLSYVLSFEPPPSAFGISKEGISDSASKSGGEIVSVTRISKVDELTKHSPRQWT